ncbi:MAG: hypothetical protein MUO37_05080 [Methyloceanibacter sp.]|nr:hypothetical protein [Methyloceanibacter sp.]
MGDTAKLLSTDRALRDGFTLHPKDEEVLRAANVIAEAPLPKDMAAILKVGGFMTPPGLEEHSAALTLYLEIMTAAMQQMVTHDSRIAPAITKWRIEWRYSWRMVAQALNDTFGSPWSPPWNQLGGIAACRAAAEKAGADMMEPPWN